MSSAKTAFDAFVEFHEAATARDIDAAASAYWHALVDEDGRDEPAWCDPADSDADAEEAYPSDADYEFYLSVLADGGCPVGDDPTALELWTVDAWEHHTGPTAVRGHFNG